jgi:hypothetical protein
MLLQQVEQMQLLHLCVLQARYTSTPLGPNSKHAYAQQTIKVAAWGHMPGATPNGPRAGHWTHCTAVMWNMHFLLLPGILPQAT